tara:strand:- start:53 stop:526 length:474 start_codon:yes stop_codon:yes gene_type:complete
MAVLGTKWSTLADLSLAEATVEAYAATDDPRGKVSLGSAATVGHFCYFAMPNNTDANATRHFDFPITGDFTIVVNPTIITWGSNNTTLDVSVQGSVDGVNYIDLHTDILDGVTIARQVHAAVYDYDNKGRMPYMRLELTQVANEADATIIIAILPHS